MSKKLPKTLEECNNKYQQLHKIWQKYLKFYNVKIPGFGTAKSFWLIALYSEMGRPLGNTEIYKWMIQYDIFKFKKPALKSDQQIRHLAMQDGWNIKKKGDTYIDENGSIQKLNGQYLLHSVDKPFPNYAPTRRNSKLKSKTFIELKSKTGNMCLTCWHFEGETHPKNNEKIKLQQGHKDPNIELSINNVIPQCAYCNQTYKDDFIFGKDGRIKGINKIDFFYKMNQKKLKTELTEKPIPQSIQNILKQFLDIKKTSKTKKS